MCVSSTVLEISWLVFTSIRAYPTSLPDGSGKRRLGVGGHALMSWCQGARLPDRKLKAALKCTVWSKCTPVPDKQTDGQTDRRTNIMAIARRFILTNASRTKSRHTVPKVSPTDEVWAVYGAKICGKICLSAYVRPSIGRRYCVKTNTLRTIQSSPAGSPLTIVSGNIRLIDIFARNHP